MSNKSSSGGVSFFGLLTVLFIGLKLTDYIDWSWWLVLLPLYGPFVFVMLFCIAAVALD
jgi:hypothetical protein